MSARQPISWHLYRLRALWRIWRGSSAELNRRVEVENALLAVAKGARPLLSQDECCALAYRLGVPR